ncbi:MAG: MarR family transcriptional regulator [Marmoricola sp.]|jgi:DNA-binding MarR family transcriptional regulator
MSSVKAVYPREELQVPLLMGLLFREVSTTMAAEEWGGLRQSHFRVISSVPPEGISVTELAERVGMTKQGCGQFVTTLVGSGHLKVEQDRTDRRVRRVRRTPKGNRTIVSVTDRILAIEDDWASRVGERRYRTFRRVLEELALDQ